MHPPCYEAERASRLMYLQKNKDWGSIYRSTDSLRWKWVPCRVREKHASQSLDGWSFRMSGSLYLKVSQPAFLLPPKSQISKVDPTAASQVLISCLIWVAVDSISAKGPMDAFWNRFTNSTSTTALQPRPADVLIVWDDEEWPFHNASALTPYCAIIL